MSSDIYAKPHSSKMLKNIDKAEWQEKDVEIYESVEAFGNDDADLHSHEGGLNEEKHPTAVRRRALSGAVVCLGVLCFLMLAGIILLSIHLTLKKHQLEASFNKLSNDHIQLQGNYSGMAVNNSQLQSSYQTLSKNYSQLQEEVKRLKGIIKGRRCPDGWKRFGCSCYYKSSLKMSWQRSREECQRFGADLVVINTKEEQNFVSELNVEGESWIGLRRHRKTSGWDWVWDWVDGSPLTETFWASKLLHESEYASCCTPQGRWTQSRHDYKKLICER
ncbi:C-type lectin domain family 6 member A-like [Chelmon rostratus]|uniref:C-type lectin domain family 6 member A-like n=1 Tax=Chelmon rostratus TaxID=109905 RepID=UPI001BE939E0|nr:C-type lectin domain family 6 member A-like [Chelmon rostratus]